ncbi:Hsp70 family protein [Amycolatopsis sp. NPDC098790]|uniref:caspase, EACC1-associated type n=1 Tax=Amycolatopsis sp. NPDC098790 TaxID=3363939 RepID=UPI0037FE356E
MRSKTRSWRHFWTVTLVADMARRCLIVANQRYQDPAFAELPGAAEDADALERLLTQPAIGGFEVEVVLDGGGVAVRRAIELFFQRAERADVLWLHISCHGMKNRDNRLFLVTADTERDLLASTGIDCTFINDQVDSCRSAQIVVSLDCCYSGAYSRGMRTRSTDNLVDVAEAFGGKGRVVITASNALQFSHESIATSRDTAKPSIFTQAIVKGLATGDADVDLDGLVSVDDLYDYVYREVCAQLPNQTPTRSVSSAEGTILLARNVRVGASWLPTEVVRASRSRQVWQRRGVVDELDNLLDSDDIEVRGAAVELLATLAADHDSTVADRARVMWSARGLGKLRAPIAPKNWPPDHRAAAVGGPPASSPVDEWPKSSLPVGIDFGTTTSSVAVYVRGKHRLLPNEFGNLTTPSVAALSSGGEWLVGERARNQAVTNALQTFFGIRNKLGSDWVTAIGGRRLTADDIAAVILGHLKRDAERAIQGRIHDVVMTVPTYFGLSERRALVNAAQKAGLAVQRLVTEPIAAAMTLQRNESDSQQTILIVDLGGGTLDVALVEVGFGASSAGPDDQWVAEVRAVRGRRLGGDDWDAHMVNFLLTRLRETHDIDLRSDPTAMRWLRDTAERVRIELSDLTETTVSLPYLGAGVAVTETISRVEFDRMTADLVDQVTRPINAVVRDAGISIGDIEETLLLGGAGRMPAISACISGLTGRTPRLGLFPNGVAHGAASQAAILHGRNHNSLLLDAIPWSVGIETNGGVYRLIERNTTVPTKRMEVFTTVEDSQTAVQLRIFQGELDVAASNRQLGTIMLAGLRPARRGALRIEVAIEVHVDMSVEVRAVDRDTGTAQRLMMDADAVRLIAPPIRHAAVAHVPSPKPSVKR